MLRAFKPHVVYVISWGLGQSPRSKHFSDGSKCGCDARSLGEVVTEPIFSTVGVSQKFYMIYTAKVKTLKVVFQCSLRYLHGVGCVDHIWCAAR